MRVFRKLRSAHPSLPLPYIYRMVSDSPSQRFWVSEERAAIVISEMIRGYTHDKMGMVKREMYAEIYRRYKKEAATRPKDSTYSIVFDIVNSPAPKFYLTPGSVKVLIHKIRHKWYEKRRPK